MSALYLQEDIPLTSKIKSNRIATSVKIDKEIHKIAKIYAIEHDIELSDLMGLALLRYCRK